MLSGWDVSTPYTLIVFLGESLAGENAVWYQHEPLTLTQQTFKTVWQCSVGLFNYLPQLANIFSSQET